MGPIMVPTLSENDPFSDYGPNIVLVDTAPALPCPRTVLLPEHVSE